MDYESTKESPWTAFTEYSEPSKDVKIDVWCNNERYTDCEWRTDGVAYLPNRILVSAWCYFELGGYSHDDEWSPMHSPEAPELFGATHWMKVPGAPE